MRGGCLVSKQKLNQICQKINRIFKLYYFIALGIILSLISKEAISVRNFDLVNDCLIGLAIIALLLIVYLVAFLISMAIEKDVKYKYAKGGSLYRWYDMIHKYNTKIKWLNKVIKNFKEGYGLDFSEIETFVSPSGNKGRYEKELSSKFKNTQFIVTDLNIPEDHEESTDNYIYLSQNNNAFCIKEYLSNIGVFDVNVIWDIKGAIWYNSKGKDLESILKTYYDVLSSEGIILIDGYEGTRIGAVVNIFLRRFGLNVGYPERSSFTQIRKNINSTILSMYDIHKVGDGKYTMYVLKKKIVLKEKKIS
ncbi:hypothetical protein D3C87_624160 [compost metagenome]